MALNRVRILCTMCTVPYRKTCDKIIGLSGSLSSPKIGFACFASMLYDC